MSTLMALAIQMKVDSAADSAKSARELREKLKYIAEAAKWVGGCVVAGDLSEGGLQVGSVLSRAQSAASAAQSATDPGKQCDAIADELKWVSAAIIWAIKFGAMQTEQVKELKKQVEELKRRVK